MLIFTASLPAEIFPDLLPTPPSQRTGPSLALDLDTACFCQVAIFISCAEMPDGPGNMSQLAKLVATVRGLQSTAADETSYHMLLSQQPAQDNDAGPGAEDANSNTSEWHAKREYEAWGSPHDIQQRQRRPWRRALRLLGIATVVVLAIAGAVDLVSRTVQVVKKHLIAHDELQTVHDCLRSCSHGEKHGEKQVRVGIAAACPSSTSPSHRPHHRPQRRRPHPSSSKKVSTSSTGARATSPGSA